MDLTSYLKYCLGYVRLSQSGGCVKSEATAQELGASRLDLIKLLNSDLDGAVEEPIQLPLFSSLDPQKVPPEQYALTTKREK